MSPPEQFHTHLTFLQQKLACITRENFPTWDDNHIDGFIIMHAQVLNMLDLWHKATIKTSSGWMLTPNKRRYILRSYIQIITTSHDITSNIDERGKQVVSEIGEILEKLGEVFLKFDVLEKTP